MRLNRWEHISRMVGSALRSSVVERLEDNIHASSLVITEELRIPYVVADAHRTIQFSYFKPAGIIARRIML